MISLGIGFRESNLTTFHLMVKFSLGMNFFHRETVAPKEGGLKPEEIAGLHF